MNRFPAMIAILVIAVTGLSATAARAQPAVSRCLAVAQEAPRVRPVLFRPAAIGRQAQATGEVAITYVGHSTFLIESPQGIRIATDYAGSHGPGAAPDVVTMNHAHPTHYTDDPDPAIAHVLRGWNPQGGGAEHHLSVGDVYIRNVPTNIRSWAGGTEEFGNSIFVFEVAGLCIGHLGHLHHELTDEQIARIGQLDIALVPVDGGYTLDHPGMAAVLRRLRPRIVIPMHFFAGLDRFIAALEGDYAVRFATAPTLFVSPATLPARPELVVLPRG